MKPAVRWGFLGAGRIASQALAPAVHAAAGATLQAVAARNESRARGLEPAGRTYTDYAQLCADPDVDVVYVALPGSAHVPWSLRALAAGKHVLCEKPIGLDAAEVQLLIDAAASADRMVVEASWNRWHPRTQRLGALVDAGDLGDSPLTVETAFSFDGVPDGDFRLDPAQGGGALYDVGCYAVAAAGLVLGSQSLEVQSTQAVFGPTGVDLTTVAQLSGPRGTATATASIDSPEHQVVAVRSGTASAELVFPAFSSWRESSVLRRTEGSRTWDETFEAVDAYQLMVEAMSRAVAGDAASWVLPISESLVIATTLDRIRQASEGLTA